MLSSSIRGLAMQIRPTAHRLAASPPHLFTAHTAHSSTPLTAHSSRCSLTALVPLLGLTQDEQAHFWQNASIQVLTVCMAYAAVVSLPYRAANAVHLWLSHRSSATGLDFYGRSAEHIG